mgnify:CR=1 FL=1
MLDSSVMGTILTTQNLACQAYSMWYDYGKRSKCGNYFKSGGFMLGLVSFIAIIFVVDAFLD